MGPHGRGRGGHARYFPIWGSSRMNRNALLWTLGKVVLIAFMTVVEASKNSPRSAHDGPYWMALVPLLLIPILISRHVRMISRRTQQLTAPCWSANPCRLFSDPFPFYHLAGWACLVSGVVSIGWGLLKGLRVDVPLMEIVCGFTLLLTIRRVGSRLGGSKGVPLSRREER